MHSDLLMLRVACRVVEGDRRDADATTNSSNNSNHTNTNIMLPRLVLPTVSMSTATSTAAPWDARRILIPALQPPAKDAADLMLGLKRLSRPANSEEERGEDDDSDHTPRPSKRARLPPPPGVFMDSPLAKLVHAQRPPPPAPPMISPLGVEGIVAGAPSPLDNKSQTRRVAPSTFMAFMNQQATTHTRLQVSTTVDAEHGEYEKLSPLDSPRLLEPVSVVTRRIPTLPQWRSPVLAHAAHAANATRSPQPLVSPLPSLSSVTASASRPTASMPPLSLPTKASTKPTLVRTSSSAAWRQAMPPHDRTRTRERLLRGFDRQCRADYDALLHIVSAFEEELLHAHTTSKGHYFFQTVALTDRIGTITQPRTFHGPP